MKKLIIACLIALSPVTGFGQVLKLVATDTFHGAGAGGLLWVGTALISEGGLSGGLGESMGFGILAGAGMGVFDSYTVLNNGNPYRNGLMTQHGTTMQIVTMDALYGGAIGGMIGVAVGLISKSEGFLSGVGKGAGWGIWVGFGVGIVDAIFLAAPSMNSQGSIIQKQGEGWSLTAISPELRTERYLTESGKLATGIVPTINLLKINF